MLHEALQTNFVTHYRDDVTMLQQAYTKPLPVAVDLEYEIFHQSRLDSSYKASVIRKVHDLKGLTQKQELSDFFTNSITNNDKKSTSCDNEETKIEITKLPTGTKCAKAYSACQSASQEHDSKSSLLNEDSDTEMAWELLEQVDRCKTTEGHVIEQIVDRPTHVSDVVIAAETLKPIQSIVKEEPISSIRNNSTSQLDLFSLHNSSSTPAIDISQSMDELSESVIFSAVVKNQSPASTLPICGADDKIKSNITLPSCSVKDNLNENLT